MKLKIFLTFIVLITCHAISAKDYLITNQSNAENKTIDREFIKNVFLGTKLFWENGTRIQPVHLPIDNKSFDTFLENIVEMDTKQFLAYWRRKLFSGRAHPPKQISKIKDIIKFVEENPDSIAVLPEKPDNIPSEIYVIELH